MSYPHSIYFFILIFSIVYLAEDIRHELFEMKIEEMRLEREPLSMTGYLRKSIHYWATFRKASQKTTYTRLIKRN